MPKHRSAADCNRPLSRSGRPRTGQSSPEISSKNRVGGRVRRCAEVVVGGVLTACLPSSMTINCSCIVPQSNTGEVSFHFYALSNPVHSCHTDNGLDPAIHTARRGVFHFLCCRIPHTPLSHRQWSGSIHTHRAKNSVIRRVVRHMASPN